MQKTILVVEDEKDLADILTDELSSNGYRVVTAQNGREGLDMLQSVEPDLIICDRVMPLMSGYELLERIRGAYPQYGSLPFIFLTALADPRDRHSVNHLNPTAYLEKPVNFDKLLQTIKSAIGNK